VIDEKKIEAIFLKKLGARIKNIRKKKGIRQNEIAWKCNFDKSSFSNIEAGKRNITILSLQKIANALEEPIENFIKDL